MNIVFIGASKFGWRCLDEVRKLEACKVVGVVTAPKTFSISYRPEGVTNVLHASIDEYCKSESIPCVALENGMNNPILLEQVKKWDPDVFIVVGWYHMLNKAWREISPAYGLHASLLPDYSGGAPLVWAILNGEKETGITLFQFDDGVDSGPILGQKKTAINDEDTIASLYGKIEELGLELLREHLPKLALGDAELIEQDNSKRRIFPQRNPDDGVIDWGKSSREIYNFVRAQTKPYPGAFTELNGEKVHIWEVAPAKIEGIHVEKGQVFECDSEIYVSCGDNELLNVLSMSINGVDQSPRMWWHGLSGKIENGIFFG